METVKTLGLILRAFDLAEKDKVVSVYTRKMGKINGVVSRGSGRGKAFAGNVEPFSLVELIFLDQAHRDLLRIQDLELIESFGTRLPSYVSFLYLSFIAEILQETVPEREPNDALFRLLMMVLPQLKTHASEALAALYFQIWHLKIAGLFPETRTCQKCARTLERADPIFLVDGLSGLVCSKCKQPRDQQLSEAAHNLLVDIRQHPLTELQPDGIDPRSLAELSRITEEMLEKNFERHFQSLHLLRIESG